MSYCCPSQASPGVLEHTSHPSNRGETERPGAVGNLPRSHSESAVEPACLTPTQGRAPWAWCWALTIVWSLQDQVPCGFSPAALRTGHGDAA